jgi:hypothetical protein
VQQVSRERGGSVRPALALWARTPARPLRADEGMSSTDALCREVAGGDDLFLRAILREAISTGGYSLSERTRPQLLNVNEVVRAPGFEPRASSLPGRLNSLPILHRAWPANHRQSQETTSFAAKVWGSSANASQCGRPRTEQSGCRMPEHDRPSRPSLGGRGRFCPVGGDCPYARVTHRCLRLRPSIGLRLSSLALPLTDWCRS